MAEKQVVLPRVDANFRIDRTKEIEKMYKDVVAVRNSIGDSNSFRASGVGTSSEVRASLNQGTNSVSNLEKIVDASRQTYATDSVYASIIDYLANMFLWRYKVTPHLKYRKTPKPVSAEDYAAEYASMLEIVDGLSIEVKFPAILTELCVTGAVYVTTELDKKQLTLSTMLLPYNFCRVVGATQFGTNIIDFDCAFFDQFSSATKEEMDEILASFTEEIQTGYKAYKKNRNEQWCTLDPRFSTGLSLNTFGLPTYATTIAGLRGYEKFELNEQKKSDRSLGYLITQKIPHYEDKPLLEMTEVNALHKSMKKVIEQDGNTRLITTFGDIGLESFAQGSSIDKNEVEAAYSTIFNDGGLNSSLFNGKTIEALNYSILRDKNKVWKFVLQLQNFFNLCINNVYNFKNYQADLEILPISAYTYHEDINVFKTNATLGVGKLDYLVASGIKQKNIADHLQLEEHLGLNKIQPMQTAYTQTAEDREGSEIDNNKTEETTDTSKDIEPSDGAEE